MLTQEIKNEIFEKKEIKLFLKRLDLDTPFYGGNKIFKLKYNLEEAKKQGHQQLLTFGGGFSNHIAAVAHAGKLHGFKTTGIIRGEENTNPVLQFATEQGMQLNFISRENYKLKNENNFLQYLLKKFGESYVLPEGGTNELAIKGCMEIISEEDNFDVVCVPCGTGGTLAGIILSLPKEKNALGFSALKGNFMIKNIKKILKNINEPVAQWDVIEDYHFSGYAKFPANLINFIEAFKIKYAIAPDPVYNAKMLYGIIDLIKQDYFKKGTTIMAIITGGYRL